MRNISFEVASIIISIVMLVNLHETRKIPAVQNFIFIALVVCNMCSSFFTVIYESALSLNCGRSPMWVGEICNVGYYITHVTCLPILLIYMMSMLKSWRETSLMFRICAFAPSLIANLFILVTPFTEMVFYFDEQGIYHRGKFITVIYGIAVFYTIFIISYMIYNIKYYSMEKKVAVFSTGAFTVLAVIVQFFFPSQLVEACAVSIGELVLFFSIQNPRSMLDNVSGAYNNSAFLTSMEVDFSTAKKFSILEVVIDDLSLIERTFGTKKSEAIIVRIKKYLQSFDKKARVYHVKTNFFCVEFVETESDKVESIALSIKERFLQVWDYDGVETLLSVRICRIDCPEIAPSVEAVNEYIHYFRNDKTSSKYKKVTQKDMARIKRSRIVSEALDSVIDKDKIDLWFTPVYSVSEQKIVSAEATVGFYDEKLGYVSQQEFISIAEANGQIIKISENVFSRICSLIKSGLLQQLGVEYISMEIFAIQCLQDDMAEKILNYVKNCGIDTSMIRVIVSEYTISKSASAVENVLFKLNDSGIKVCLDDYGRGYSNISYIYNIPFSMIKISRSVISSATNNEKALVTLESTFSLVTELGMETAAEGVETMDSFNSVSKMSCDFLQGGVISEPLNENDLISFVKSFTPPTKKEVLQ